MRQHFSRLRLVWFWFAVAMIASTPAAGADWPMFRGNAANTGVSTGAAAGDIGKEPKFLWRFDTGGVVESSPAIADGVLYQGTFNRALFALDATSGRELWRFRVGGLLRRLSGGGRRPGLFRRRRQSLLRIR
ncbi:MAG: PQQ-binding-like beta-propeller repeat protein [Alphaproteobacteria bacterium]|nr:PQQ-binding-like beta-propeller repeat protein [Alphaproteobacteria bacterium]